MEILQLGRADRAKRKRAFDCFYCKCRYEAEVGEFILRKWYLAGRIRFEAVCRCPDCGLENVEQILDED